MRSTQRDAEKQRGTESIKRRKRRGGTERDSEEKRATEKRRTGRKET